MHAMLVAGWVNQSQLPSDVPSALWPRPALASFLQRIFHGIPDAMVNSPESVDKIVIVQEKVKQCSIDWAPIGHI